MTGMLCPADQSALEAQRRGDLRYGYCRHCHGLWFTPGMLEISDHFHAPLPRASRRAPERSPASGTMRSRRCSACELDLTVEMIDGIAVDRCAGCRGVWLDPGEFGPVRAWYLAQREADGEFTRYTAADTVAAGAQRVIDVIFWGALLAFLRLVFSR